jgi:alpha-beta hydrolase superfamily lysophospholipase
VARTDARVGGRLLDDALDGLAASRAAGRQSRPRTTVLAHSYGTVVVDEAADRPGRLAADAVVLLGSPGMGSGGAASLEASEVYDAGGWADPVPALGWFGQEPWEPGFGAVPLPTDAGEVHTAYYDPAHPTLTALGQVVTGPYRPR